MKNSKGFTLMELMVVVAIIGVISAIAYPSYSSYTKKSKRSDAKVALTKLADKQERFYLQNNKYASTLASLNIASSTTEEGYYTLAIDSASASGFKATATAAAGQAADTNCTSFSLDSTGAKTSNGAADDANKCW
jgi:type IV pilus assembly protein PilE